jgi:hypothetical protein
MHSTQTKNLPTWIRWTTIAALLAASTACDSADKGASSDSSPDKTAKAKDGESGNKAGKPAVTRKAADLDDAFQKEVNDMSKMNEPMDKRIEAFVAKVGKPDKEADGNKIWHAVDGSNCKRYTIESSGAMTDEIIDKADCGL